MLNCWQFAELYGDEPSSPLPCSAMPGEFKPLRFSFSFYGVFDYLIMGLFTVFMIQIVLFQLGRLPKNGHNSYSMHSGFLHFPTRLCRRNRLTVKEIYIFTDDLAKIHISHFIRKKLCFNSTIKHCKC